MADCGLRIVTVPVTGEGMGVYNLASVYDVDMGKQRSAARISEEQREQQLDRQVSP